MDLNPQSQWFLLQMVGGIITQVPCIMGAHAVVRRMKRGEISKRKAWALFALMFIIVISPWPVYHFLGVIPH